MAKIFATHMIALKPGVKAEDFEKFVTEELYQLPEWEGWKGYLLKGARGDREGRYLWMWEIESIEVRDRYAPSPGANSEEAQQFMESHGEIFEKWATFATDVAAIYTDYVVVGK